MRSCAIPSSAASLHRASNLSSISTENSPGSCFTAGFSLFETISNLNAVLRQPNRNICPEIKWKISVMSILLKFPLRAQIGGML